MMPRKLRDRESRRMARWTRDRQWSFAERVAWLGTIWFTPWNNKNHRPQALDEWRDGLITGLELMDWMSRHSDWWIIGEWSDERDARPITITPAGRAALESRPLYDQEPVYGGLVEPGWQAVPSPKRSEGQRA